MSNLSVVKRDRKSIGSEHGKRSKQEFNLADSLSLQISRHIHDEPQEEEEQELEESMIISSGTLVQSRHHMEQIPVLDQDISAPTIDFRIGITSSDTSYTIDSSDINPSTKRSIRTSRKYSVENDLLPHLEEVLDENAIRRSIFELNQLVQTSQTDNRVVFKQETGASTEISSEESKIQEEGSVSDEKEDSGSSSSIQDDQQYNDGFYYKYKGQYDDNELRTNLGCLKWLSIARRKYCGYFQYNSLHGEGYYFIKRDDCLNFYDGKFYNNELHGYGQIIYNSGDKFEGLFRENTRFGPGIWSHKDGTQDVGIWYGNSLLRLCVHTSECMPMLGRSTVGKLKLIEYRKIIPLTSAHNDTAYSIMQDLNADEDTKWRFKELYNPHVRNSHSIFFDKYQYDHSYFGQEDNNIDVINTTSNLSDIIIVNNKNITERFDEEIMVEIGHMGDMQKELKRLRKKVKSMKTEYENDVNIQGINSLPNQEPFLKSVLEFLDFKLKKSKSDGLDSDTKKIAVDSILAWNNGDALIDIQKHSFVCRKSEDNVSFNVRHVLVGKQRQFALAGQHEQNCIQFLNTCMSSDISGALKFLESQNINPNVCDSKGNTGLHLATWSHDTKMIGMLANHGANLDSVNDEGISPLNLCLLRYFECLHGMVNWESSFLDLEGFTIDQKYLTQWRPRDSFWELLQTKFKVSNHSMRTLSRRTTISEHSTKKKAPLNKGSTLSQSNFIFSLKFVSVPQRFPTKSKSESPSSEGRKSVITGKTPIEFDESLFDKMGQEVTTLKTLLQYGADPNKEAVPYSPFFMACFSKSAEIVGYFLAARTDPNTNLHGMTALQVVACLEPCEDNCKIMQILIDYSSNPNILSDPCIWQECDAYLLGDFYPDCQMQPRGKDALHLICLREDFTDENNHFLCRMAEQLISAKLNTRRLYLGHSHISIAVIKGNLALVEYLSKYLDLARPLGFGLGNALTVLALSRYQNILPFFICKKMINLLLAKVTPFEPLYTYCNIFEFLDVDSPPDLANVQHIWNRYIRYVKSLRTHFKSQSQGHTDKRSNELSKVYIQDNSRKILDVINIFKAVFYLYCFIKEGYLDQNTCNLAKWIGHSKEALTYIRYIFNSGKMPRSYFSVVNVVEMMNFIDKVNNIRKTIGEKPDETSLHSFESHKNYTRYDAQDKTRVTSLVSLKSQEGDSRPTCGDNLDDYMKQLDGISFEEYDNAGPESFQRWLKDEHSTRYNVCYFCMHRTNKTLLRCPHCGIVKFCSERCNYLSVKLKNHHPCSAIFYRSIYNEYRGLIENGLPLPIYGIDLAFDNWRKKRKLPSAMKGNSRIIFVNSEEAGTKRYSKSVSIRLHGGANTIQEEQIFLSPYITEPNSYNESENQKQETKNITFIQENATECNEVRKHGSVTKLSNTKQHTGGKGRTITQAFGGNNEKYNKINVKKNRDATLQSVSEISNSPIKINDEMFSDIKTVGKVTKVGENFTDDAKMFSLLPYIKDKNLHVHMKEKSDRMVSKATDFPPIFRKIIKGGPPWRNQKTKSNIFNEVQNQKRVLNNELVKVSWNKHLKTLGNEQTNDSCLKKNVIQVYRYLLDDFEDLDVESMFKPFTCYSRENIFHGISGASYRFYQLMENNFSV